MKQANFKNIFITIFLVALMSITGYAISHVVLSPDEGSYYVLGGGRDSQNVTFVVTAYPSNDSTTYGIRNCSIYSNVTGTWATSQRSSSTPAGGVPVNHTLYLGTTYDDTYILWNVECCDNVSVCTFMSTNRTLHIETAPYISCNYPTSSLVVTSKTLNYNITIDGDSVDYKCDLYTNYSGDWSIHSTYADVTNGTNKILPAVFAEDSNDLSYNFYCYEKGAGYPYIYGYNDSNRTVSIDTTLPSVSFITSDNSYQATNGYINYTLTERNPSSCQFWDNRTGTYGLNQTKTALAGANFFNYNITDGVYKYYVSCNDSLNAFANSSVRTITIDSAYPYFSSAKNYTLAGNCSARYFNITFSEASNLTLYYGKTSGAGDGVIKETDFATTQTVNIPFDGYEVLNYVNLTFCDRVGQCNTTHTFSWYTPLPLCSGWSMYSLHDTSLNMSEIHRLSTADYVYWYNESAQTYTYYASSYTTFGALPLGFGDKGVLNLYSSSGTTWYRNTTVPVTYYTKNLVVGNNFLALYQSHTLGNITDYMLKNVSYGNATINGLTFRIDTIAGYNNTAQEWLLHPYQWDWNNNTKAGSPKSGIDNIWLYSPYRLIVNVTAPGYVNGNWT